MRFIKRLPHKPPLQHNEGPRNWVAGSNTQESAPILEQEYFEHFDDAKRFVINALSELEIKLSDHCDNDEEASRVSDLRISLALRSGPSSFRGTIAGCIYWVEKV